jgi:hypothetical protein
MLYLYGYRSTLSMHSLTFLVVTASREILPINKNFIINFCVGIMRYLNRIFIDNWQRNINLNSMYKLRFHITESILCLHVTNPLTLWRLVIHAGTARCNNRNSAFFLRKLCVLNESQNKERLLPPSALTDCILCSLRCVYAVWYAMYLYMCSQFFCLRIGRAHGLNFRLSTLLHFYNKQLPFYNKQLNFPTYH